MKHLSKCSNESCIKKNQCYRSANKTNEETAAYYLPVINREEDFKCNFFIEIQICKNNIKLSYV